MRDITAEDLYLFRFSGNPVFSSDGNSLAYVLSEMDKETDKYQSAIRLIDLKTGSERQLTNAKTPNGPAKDQSPQFSPDGGKIAFLSNREGKKQLYSLDLTGGEAQKLTDFKEGVRSFIWSTDSSYLVAVARKNDEETSDVKVINRLRYWGNGEGFYGKERIHLWSVSLTGEVASLTKGEFDEDEPTFSPDGRILTFVSWRNKDEREMMPSIYALDLETGEVKEIVQGKGTLHAPQFSPDGRKIAYFAHEQGETTAANTHVYVVAYPDGGELECTDSFDRTTGNMVGTDARYDEGKHLPCWSEDSTEVYFLATDKGNSFIYLLDISTHEVIKVSQESTGSVTSFSLHNQRIAYILEHPTCLGEVYLAENRITKALTHNNDRLFAERLIAEPEPFEYAGRDDWTIEGWLLKPGNFDPAKKYPLVLEIHGGPHVAYGNAFHHEFQLLAAQGYVVLYVNPRGSQGYGQKFVEAVVGDWGGKDYEDLMKAVDFAETLPYVDKNQEFVTGGSYGGYMTNWVISHTPRFRAAVTQRSICNLYSMMGTSDIGFWFNAKELGNAELWENEDSIMAKSPIRYARNVITPVKILHSEEDHRCPMEQAEQWYIALKRLGVEVELVRFPQENHDLSRTGGPKHRVERLQHLVGWFNTHRA